MTTYPDAHNIDALLSEIATMARTPGRATTSGPHFDVASEPLSVAVYEQQERRLGFRLPVLLRRLYTEVGNGGFGPGHGLLSMLALSHVDRDVPAYYLRLRESRARKKGEWPVGVVPFSNWGDLILSCLDLAAPGIEGDPPVIRYEPNMPEAATFRYLKGAPFRGAGLIPESERLSSWLEGWVHGEEMFDRPYVQDG